MCSNVTLMYAINRAPDDALKLFERIPNYNIIIIGYIIQYLVLIYKLYAYKLKLYKIVNYIMYIIYNKNYIPY